MWKRILNSQTIKVDKSLINREKNQMKNKEYNCYRATSGTSTILEKSNLVFI